MQSDWSGRGVTLRRCLGSFALVLTALALCLTTISSARAAMTYRRTLNPPSRMELYHPYAITVDGLGNIYIVDTQHHRIVKSIESGGWLKFGKFGSGRGQLAYPEGIAVQDDNFEARTLVFVADNGNSRIMVFDGDGNFVRKFGDFGSGDGQLDHPNGIASLPEGGGVVVSDARNNRISIFSQSGEWLFSYYCSDCPGGSFHTPAGIGIRKLESSSEIYVTDTYGGRVNVLNLAGTWLRSFGSLGTGPGQLYFPDDIAVDPDGSAWVAESSDTNRVSKFDPAGNFLFSFSRGAVGFNQAHGVALDLLGNVYVANTGESIVDMFTERAAKLSAITSGNRQYWLDTSGLWFALVYNGVEQTCTTGGTAKIVVDAAASSPVTFNLVGGPLTVDYTGNSLMKMDMSVAQVDLLRQAWSAGKTSSLAAKFNANCQDGIRLQVKDRELF